VCESGWHLPSSGTFDNKFHKFHHETEKKHTNHHKGLLTLDMAGHKIISWHFSRFRNMAAQQA